MLGCARDSRSHTIPAVIVGRKHRSWNLSPRRAGSPQKLPRLSGFHLLHCNELDASCPFVRHLSSMGLFFSGLMARGLGNAGCGGLCAGTRRCGGVQASPRPLPRNLGACPAHSACVCGPCAVVFRPGSEASVETCTGKRRPRPRTGDCSRDSCALPFYPLLRSASEPCGSFACVGFLPLFVFLGFG